MHTLARAVPTEGGSAAVNSTTSGPRRASPASPAVAVAVAIAPARSVKAGQSGQLAPSFPAKMEWKFPAPKK